MEISHGYDNPKVNRVIYGDTTADFDIQDWLDLALAALDQGSVTRAKYEQIRKLLPVVETLDDEGEGPESEQGE